jgi:hypothetical protein
LQSENTATKNYINHYITELWLMQLQPTKFIHNFVGQ